MSETKATTSDAVIHDEPVSEAGQRLARLLGKMTVKDLYKLMDASQVIAHRIRHRGYSQDATVAARFGRLSVKEQAETLVLARYLSDFIWEKIGGFEIDDLADQTDEDNKPTPE